jgi:parvulin-like peptidyl-prolyl isomerase
VREEVYYREALALGLDRDDTVIRRRLRQKMEFLTEGAASAAPPEEAELRAHYNRYRERFARPARITFRQVLFASAEDAAAALAALAQGGDPEALGRPTLLPPAMEAAGEAAVDGTFGPGFFARLAAVAQGAWQGPVASAYGPHLVFVADAQAAATPPFEDVRALVEEDWRRETAEALREAGYRTLRARYRVVLPEEPLP